MYDSIAPVCFDVLTFFNALLIITHWLLLTPTSARGAPFSPPELHPSLLPCLSSFFPPQPLSLVLGLAYLSLEGGGEGGWIRGNDMGLEMKRVTKTYQRAESTQRCIIIGCCGNQTRLHFFQPSSPSAQLSFPRPGREAGRGRERERGVGVVVVQD